VVYGDIGTSPLYALRECFYGPHAIPATVPTGYLAITPPTTAARWLSSTSRSFAELG
jgi:hypothetical protein